MIVVTRKWNAIDITGHSGYSAIGTDIVCSAVSALVQTLIFSLHELTDDKIAYRMESGNVHIEIGNLSKAGTLLTDSFFIGISGIKAAYPEYVKVIDYGAEPGNS